MTDEWVFPPPYLPREMYRARVMSPEEGPMDGSGWPRCRVAVEKKCFYEAHGWEPITTYDRNYSMMRTFEPFRQLRDGVWRDYALISRQYVELEVMDLQTGEVVATEQPSERQFEFARELKEKAKPESWHATATVEDIARGWGFCPVEFYVPDWLTDWDERDEKYGKNARSLEQTIIDCKADYEAGLKEHQQYRDEEYDMLRGNFGVYSGCVWGDDSSWKIRYIDLSQISEGVVTTDDRFGYISLQDPLTLDQCTKYSAESDRFSFAVAMHFSRESGEAGWWHKSEVKFQETPERYRD